MDANGFKQINTFFEQYAAALERADSKVLTQLYSVPCLFITNDSSTGFNEYSKLEGLFIQGIAVYKQFGVTSVQAYVYSKHFFTPKIARVAVNWGYYAAAGNILYDCNYQYVMRLDKTGTWRIELSVSINEKERMEHWLQTRKAAQQS